jgi:enamine deaminase RidA (YjgF/YER057c/UK114 family)
VHREICPEGIAPPAANHAQAVVSTSTGPARWLHTSGIVPIRPDGTVPVSLGDQALVVWQNLGAVLAAADMTPRDVVSVCTYVVPDQDLTEVVVARDRFFGDHRAASTLVVVNGLVREDWLLEVALVASTSPPSSPSSSSTTTTGRA